MVDGQLESCEEPEGPGVITNSPYNEPTMSKSGGLNAGL